MRAAQPDIRPYSESGKTRYILNQDYKFTFLKDGALRRFVIKRVFKYDGATVPSFFMFLTGFERDGIHRAGALIHDYMYRRRGCIWDINITPLYYSRKEADKIFLKAIELHGVKSWHGRVAYLAVRAFGGLYKEGKWIDV